MSGLDISDVPDRQPRKVRRAGARWRLLVHEALHGGWGGNAYHVQSQPSRRPDNAFTTGDGDTFTSTTTVLAGTEFDELVVGRWIHVEQMDVGTWWMNVGGVTLWVRADREGRPTSVSVYGPGCYADPVDGVEYDCSWSDPPAKEE